MRVGLVFGGKSVEHVVSVRSARTVHDGLKQAGHEVIPLAVAENGAWLPPADGARVLAGTDKAVPVPPEDARASVRHVLAAQVDAVFPIIHGTFGEDGTLQGFFEILDIPYVGCGVAASAVAMDKLMSKRAFEAAGLPVVPYAVVTRRAFEADAVAALEGSAKLSEPLFVKPSVGGSSVGCKLVKTRAELAAAVQFALSFDDTVLVEKGVRAREVEIAVLGAQGALSASVLGEIVPGNEFYDYEDKYLNDSAKLLAPAPVEPALAARIQSLATRAMDAIGGAGLARVDFFVEKEGPGVWLNEINTLPGFTTISMYPRLWGLSGVPLPQLCDRLVALAVERQAQKRRLEDSTRRFVDGAKK
jgi:D-alanine-D-alanine ligase